jgi:hypothetical protein
MAFIEGALDLEISTQSEVISTAQEQHAANSPKNSEDQIQELGSFYADNPSRLLFLSIITFGFYTYLWTYRHWRHYKRLALKSKPSLPSRQKDRHIAPFWCASFQPFYIVGAARRVQARLEDLNIKHKPLKPWLVFLLFNLHWITEIPWSPLGFQSTESIATNLVILLFYVFLLYVSVYQQARIQRLANRVLENENYLLQFRSLKAWDYLIITTGVIGTLLICIGALVPPWMVDLFHRQF